MAFPYFPFTLVTIFVVISCRPHFFIFYLFLSYPFKIKTLSIKQVLFRGDISSPIPHVASPVHLPTTTPFHYQFPSLNPNQPWNLHISLMWTMKEYESQILILFFPTSATIWGSNPSRIVGRNITCVGKSSFLVRARRVANFSFPHFIPPFSSFQSFLRIPTIF